MLKEKALRTIKAEFKEYKQRILTNLSKEYIFKIAYQIYVKSRIYDFLIKGWEYPSEIYEIIISLHKHKINILESLYSYFLKYEYADVEDWQNMQEWIKECLEKEGNLNDK